MQRFDTSRSSSTRLRTVSDPLADFCAERHTPVKPVATPSMPRARATRAPSAAPIAAVGSGSDTPRVVLAFAVGVVCGLLLGAIGLYPLVTAEWSLPEPVAHAARAVVAYGSSLSGVLHR